MSKIGPTFPYPLFAVGFGSAAAYFGNLPVSLVQPCSGSINWITELPAIECFTPALATGVFSLWAIASVETLLSSSCMDKEVAMREEKMGLKTRSLPHDPNQELIGQGLGNMAATCAGGFVGTGLIARGVISVRSGAQTRMAGIFNAGFNYLCLSVGAPILSLIPNSALVGVLIFVGGNLSKPGNMIQVYKTHPHDSLSAIVTVTSMMGTNLLTGTATGILFSLAQAGMYSKFEPLTWETVNEDDKVAYKLSGALSFLSPFQISKLEDEIIQTIITKTTPQLCFDTSDIIYEDYTGNQRLKMLKDSILQRYQITIETVNKNITTPQYEQIE
jgi:MFS superfamily sulfate permease-like transporter